MALSPVVADDVVFLFLLVGGGLICVTSWKLWRKAMKICFLRDVRLHLAPNQYFG
jgi:hypothetical protein